jgi:hypothetical protein
MDRVFRIDDLASGEVMFAATAVTDGSLLPGVRFTGDGATTQSVVMRSRSETVRFIEARHRFETKPDYNSGPRAPTAAPMSGRPLRERLAGLVLIGFFAVIGLPMRGLLFASVLIGIGCQKPEGTEILAPPAGNGGTGGGDAATGSDSDPDGSDQGQSRGSINSSIDSNVRTGSGEDVIDAGTEAAGGPDGDIDAAQPVDLAADMGADSAPSPPLVECTMPSIDRLEQWLLFSDVGAVTVPPSGSILVPEGDHQIGMVSFLGTGWHAVATWPRNTDTSQVDLSPFPGFTLTYSATADFWIQLREVANYMTGAHFVFPIPRTNGQVQTIFVPFVPRQWTVIPFLGKPTVTFAVAMTQVRGLVIIGNTPNTLVFRGLRIGSYVPPCL